MKGVCVMEEMKKAKDIIQGCSICHSQGKMSLMEGAKDESYMICPVHGIISNKFWHDIFEDLSWAMSIA